MKHKNTSDSPIICYIHISVEENKPAEISRPSEIQ